MNFFRTLGAYVAWHYSRGITEFAILWGNILAFENHFFSVPLLLRTLFSRWRRLGDDTRSGGFNPGQMFGSFIVNTLMRIVGFCVRLPTLIVGVFLLVLTALAFPVVIVLWIILPPVALLMVIGGLWVTIFGL